MMTTTKNILTILILLIYFNFTVQAASEVHFHIDNAAGKDIYAYYITHEYAKCEDQRPNPQNPDEYTKAKIEDDISFKFNSGTSTNGSACAAVYIGVQDASGISLVGHWQFHCAASGGGLGFEHCEGKFFEPVDGKNFSAEEEGKFDEDSRAFVKVTSAGG